MEAVVAAVTTGFEAILGWLGTFITALTTTEGELYALLGLLGIGIAVSVLKLASGTVRSFMWGW